MSTYWGYHCATCNQSTDHFLRHGDNILRDVAKIAPALFEVLDRLPKRTEGWLELKLLGDDPDVMAFEWLREHNGHKVMVENEYGKREEL